MAITYPTGLDNFTNPLSTDQLTSPDHAGQHSDINDAVEALEAYAGVTGSTVATSLTNQISLKAPTASPTFTGTPTLPTGTIATTQTALDSSTKVATTAFVTTANNLKADLASPTFTGTPTLPTGTIATTQTAGNSTTAVATTAFVTTANQLFGTYTAYTPTLTAITIGNGTLTGQYSKVNDFVHVTGSFTLGSTSAITGSIGISPPVNINSSMGYAASPLGFCNLYDTSSGAMNNLQLLWASATEMRVRAINTAGSYSVMVVTSATIPITWATGDILTWQAIYRAA